jgi:hypothetical protein
MGKGNDLCFGSSYETPKRAKGFGPEQFTAKNASIFQWQSAHDWRQGW